MGTTADQLREEIDQKRDDASRKIDEVEARIEGTAENVRDEVRQTAQDVTDQVKETLDLKSQIEERPLVAIGVGLAAGFLLGGMGGGESHGSSSHGRALHSGVMNTLRDTAKESGLNDTLAAAASALMGVATTQAKGIAGERVAEMTGHAKKNDGSKTVVKTERAVTTDPQPAPVR